MFIEFNTSCQVHCVANPRPFPSEVIKDSVKNRDRPSRNESSTTAFESCMFNYFVLFYEQKFGQVHRENIAYLITDDVPFLFEIVVLEEFRFVRW